MQVFQRAVQFKLQPVVAEAGCQPLANGGRACRRFLRVRLAVRAHIAHAVGIAQGSKRVHVEIARRVDGGIEHEHTEGIPVAVDVLRAGGTRTGQLVVRHHVRHGILRRREIHMSHDAALVVLYVVVVEQPDILRERRLQSGVTLAHVQRVRVVSDVEQVGHRRLTGRAAIGEA